ncbi:MAG TPA: extradiol dioxygenase [Acidimicrobiia bacterium]|nr:extradiol dioxygenase [Acidimicrobiia bacterium]
MITGAHAIIHCTAAEEARAFLSDVFGFPSVDAGHGWLIFALPPAEAAVHPTDGPAHHELYLMCDDLQATMADLEARGARCGPVTEQRWGLVTSVAVPGGAELGLYEPRHPTAISLSE